MLKGIGSASIPIPSCQKVDVTCDINGTFVEVSFHIVEDHETPCDLLVGAEIVKSTGLGVLVTGAGATVMRQSAVLHINSTWPGGAPGFGGLRSVRVSDLTSFIG